MKTFKLVIQVIGIIIIVFIGVGILPNIISNYKLSAYVRNEIAIHKDDPEQKENYLKGLARVNEYVLQLEPLVVLSDSIGNSSYSFDLYLTSLTGNDAIDGIFIFINYVKFENFDFNELALTVYYDKPVRRVNNNLYNNLEHTIVTKDSIIKGFYISNLELTNPEGLAVITGLQFGIKISDEFFDGDFISISNDDIGEDVLFKSNLDPNINLDAYGLSNVIISKDNVPTEEEKYEYNLYFERFDPSVLNNYGSYTWTWYLIYVGMLMPIVYFGYIRGLIKLYKSRPNKIEVNSDNEV